MPDGGWVVTHEDVTPLKTHEAALEKALETSRETHTRLDAAINNMSHGLVMCDAKARIVVVNDKYIEMYGLSADVAKPGCTFRELIAHRAAVGHLAGDPDEYYDGILARVAHEKNFDIQAVTPAGREILIHNRSMPGGGWIATHQDVTDQKRAARQLDETRRFLDSVIENAPIAIVVKDAATMQLVLVNRAYEELLGMDRADLIGKTVHDFYHPAQAERVMRADRGRFDSALGRTRVENPLETPDGRHHHVATTSFAIRDIEGKPQYLIVALEDITESKKAAARIAHMAHHDSLTNLPNRVFLQERLKELLGRVSGDAPLAVLYVDLDHFKRVNDTLGHLIGNDLLKVVADRLRGCIGENDMVARLGGDEFLIVRTGVKNAEDAAAFASAVREAVAAPIVLDGNQIFADLSIGIAVAPEHGTDTPQLMKYADMALYAAKSDGRGTFRFFEPAMSAKMNERRVLEIDLRKAIEQGELELYYQPLVTLGTDEIGGFEALLRWHHPERGLIPPAEFIPVAEDSGLISSIGAWALRTACFEAASWPDKAKVAVNVSPVQFKNGNLALAVAGILDASGLSPRRLEIEITEAVLMDESETTLQTLHRLHDLGVRIAMDDFGTGYSSLSYLRSFPFDKIKIDRSFVGDLCESEDSVAIVRSIANLAASLNIVTTAEGVETLSQLELVRALGCTEAQGFLFGRPKRGAELDEYFTGGAVTPGGSRSAA
jgi:diguanylate cyclase (GGDEF)-like protein/PAS domain S-box-containing protein